MKKIEDLSKGQLLRLIVKQQEKISSLQVATEDIEIAIVGMDCRFPGKSNSLDSFWDLLERGEDGVQDDTSARWDASTYLGGVGEPGKSYSLSAGLVDDVDQFDPLFFGVSPREAETMDPQQRLTLETSWRALEHAGIPASSLAGTKTGVFIGVGDNEYMQHCYASTSDENLGHVASSNALNVIAGRVAYTLGLQGPCMVVDTACSSSLVAIHLACQSLRNGESQVALAGGVNVLVAGDTFVSLAKANMLSPSGRCHTFSNNADGYVRAEGCGVVVLKRLRDAQRDGDRVLAVIKGSAINQDGRSSSLTAPNGPAQVAVIRDALAAANVRPDQIQMVETHGTGTGLGDPIEVQALDTVYGPGHTATQPLYLGALKSNIGHAESAAGVAALIKVVLCLQKQKIPGNLHGGEINPKISADFSRLVLPESMYSWPESQRAMAAVSAFGFSGTNAHMILAAVDTAPGANDFPHNQLENQTLPVVISARSKAALKDLLETYYRILASQEISLGAFASTLAQNRNHYAHRVALCVSSVDELRRQIGDLLRNDLVGVSDTSKPAHGSTVFLFTGQGSQYAQMGEQLYHTNASFRGHLDRCCAALDPYLDIPLLSLLWGNDSQQLNNTRYTQPALFALEYALASLWLDLGVEPDYVMGHSVGEYAAACIAGVFSLADASKLICARGELMSELHEPGSMLAVLAPLAQVEPFLSGFNDVSIGAINGPASLVLSGAAASVKAIEQLLSQQQIGCQFLKVSHAFHSPLMTPMLAAFREVAESLAYGAPRFQLVSNLTGQVENKRVQTADYWVEHVLAPVNFYGGMQTIGTANPGQLLEVGPSATLLGMGRRCIAAEDALWLPSLRQGQCWDPLSQALARLYTQGINIHWQALFGQQPVLTLPGHPLQKSRFWLSENRQSPVAAAARPIGHPLLGTRLPLPGDDYLYLANWVTRSPAYFDHHRLYQQVVVPAASHVSLLLMAAAKTFNSQSLELRDLLFPEALTLEDTGEAMIQLYLHHQDKDNYKVELKRIHEATGETRLHAEGRIAAGKSLPAQVDGLAQWLGYQQDYERHFDGGAFYSEFWDLGYTLGSAFCWIQEGWQRGETVVAKMAPPALPDGADDYSLYPGLIDSCFQLIACCATGADTRLNSGKIYIPFTVDRFQYRPINTNAQALWCVASLREKPSATSNRVLGDITLFDSNGQVIAQIDGFQARVTDDKGLFHMLGKSAASQAKQPLYSLDWHEVYPDDHQPINARETNPWLVIGDKLLAEGFSQAGVKALVCDPQALQLSGATAAALADSWRRHLPMAGTAVAGIVYQAQASDPVLLAQELLNLAGLITAVQDVQLAPTHGFTLVVNQLHPDQQEPALAALQALCKVMTNEGVPFAVRSLSLAQVLTPAQLINSLNCAISSPNEQLSIKDGHYFAPYLVPAAQPAAAVQALQVGWYAVTGGMGGIGFEVARYLAQGTATGLVLLGRSAPSLEVEQWIADSKIPVRIARCDITDADSLQAWAAQLDADNIQLTGLIHAAGVVKDQSLRDLDAVSVQSVLAPKVSGTRNLLVALDKHPLKHVIGFSSMSSLLGTQGQAAYAVANAYLTAELNKLQAERGIGISLLWGPWTQVGMANRLDNSVQQYYRERGITAFDITNGIAAFAAAATHHANTLGVIDVDWTRYLSGAPESALLSRLVTKTTTVSTANELSALAGLPAEERLIALNKGVKALVARAMGASIDVFLDDTIELTQLGVDSLIAVELRNKLQKQFGANIAIADMMGGMTLTGLVTAAQASLGELNTAEEEVALVISEADRYKPFPITDMQQAYWIGRTGVFDLGGMSLHGYKEIESDKLDMPRFETAWQRLVDRHDMLRAFILPSGEQQVASHVEPYRIAIQDLRGLPASEVQAALMATRDDMSHQVLPLDTWPAFDIRASLLDGNRTRLHLSVDGTYLDFRSFLILFRELILLYKDTNHALPALALKFRDYVLTQRAQEGSPAYNRSLEYWTRRIETIAPAPELPLVKKPSQVKNHRSKRWESSLSVSQWSAFKDSMQAHGLTQAATLLAVYGEILATWSSSPKFCINVPVFNRQGWHADVNHVLGNFSSFTLVEFDYSAAMSFVERVKDVQRQLMEGLQYHHISGVQIMRMINQARGKIAAGAYPCVYTSLPSGVDEWDSSLKSMITSELGDIQYTISQTPQVWIDVHVWYESGGLEFNWDAVDELFPEGMVDSMFGAYCTMIENLAGLPAYWTQTQIDLVPDNQRQLFAQVNDTAAPVGTQLLQEMFFQAALQYPNELAVITSTNQLTYAELQARANRLAHLLRDQGVGRNQLVAVAMPKSAEQIVAVMGILMAGGAYLPVDINQPQSRMDYLLADGEVKIVLVADEATQARQWPQAVRVYDLNQLLASNTAELDSELLAPVQRQNDLAYVLYTSGSTGKPKGVMISHRNVVSMVEHTNGHFHLTAGDRAFNITALNHDLSVYDIFGCLSAGAGLVIPDEDKRREPLHWLELMQAHKVTLWNSVPALMDMLLESIGDSAELALPQLRVVILGGDWVAPALPNKIHRVAPAADCLAIGGPTETTVWNIWNFMNDAQPEWTSIPYGKPISNNRYYILNSGGKPCPLWVPGELCCAGEGVAQGYLNDPENTLRSFVKHPFTGEAIYKTGDLGRYLPDGKIEFLGRKDFQMKIRGQRIEAGEIEQALLSFEGVDNAVVVDAGEGLQKHLVAHVALSEGTQNFAQANKTADFLSEDEQQGVLTNAIERLEFTLGERGLRRFDGEQRINAAPAAEVATYLQRQSFRKYEGELNLEQLLATLSCLAITRIDGQVLPKYRYPSAGGLYPVQTYLFIKPDAIKGMAGGYYYYDPAANELVQLAAAQGTETDLYAGYLKPLYNAAAFSLFLVADLNAIQPMYGQVAQDFCFIEAGYMGQLLMSGSTEQLVGLCPVGGLQEQPEFRAALRLSDSHQLVHSFTGGAILAEQLEYWLEKPRAADDAELKNPLTLEEELLEHLRGFVPEYMIPTRIVFHDKLPLTENGKVDRKTLRENTQAIGAQRNDDTYVAPASPTEQRFADILAEILNQPRVNVEGNFFEMGANSIHMVKIQKRFKEELGCELAVTDLFRYPTLRSLIAYLHKDPDEKRDFSANRDRAAKRAAALGRNRQTTLESENS